MPPDQPPSQFEPAYYPPQAPGPQPMAPAPLPPERPRPTTVRQDISPPVHPAFLVICIIGIAVLTIGALYGATGSFSTHDWEERQDITVHGRMVVVIGAALLSVGLLAAGFAARDISPRNRSTLYMAGVIIMAIVLIWPSY